MSINVDDFEIDPNPKYCPVCEELVIMRKGKRSCKCTRVYGLDPTGMRCLIGLIGMKFIVKNEC